MITLKDCRAFCDGDPATVARVARHEQLPEILAIACVQSRVMKPRPRLVRNPIDLAHAAFLPQRLVA